MEIKLKLKVRDVEIELTKDEAVKLRELLNDLVGKETVTKWEYVQPRYPWWDVYPYRIYCDTWTNATYTANTARISDDVQVTYTYS